MKVACRCRACGYRSAWEMAPGVKPGPFLAQLPCGQCRAHALVPAGPEIIRIGTLGSRAVSR